MKSLLERLEYLKAEFLRLADEDAEVFAPLAAAYGLPTGTEEERSHKAEVLEGHLMAASLVPMAVMERCMEALDILEILAVKGSRLAVSDVGAGVQFIRSALLGAKMNVSINTKAMNNKACAEQLNKRADEMAKQGSMKADDIYGQVETALRTKA